jgi:hypothetical protein
LEEIKLSLFHPALCWNAPASFPSFLPTKERGIDPPGGGADRVSRLCERHLRKCMAASLLTPTSLRSSPFSMASYKEGKKQYILMFLTERLAPERQFFV